MAAAALTCLLGGGQAHGAPMELRGELPFTRVELEGALEARGVALRHGLTVSPSGARELVLRYGPHAQRVEIDGLGKEALLRRLALLLASLVEGDLVVPLPPLPPPPPPPPAPAPTPPGDALRLSASGTVGMGPDGPKALLGGGLDLSLRLYGPLRLVVAAELLHRPNESSAHGELSSLQLPLRLGAAWAFDSLDLEARLLLGIAPLWVTGSGDERGLSHGSWLPSLGLALVYAVALTQSLALRIGLGAELRLRRQELRLRGVPTHITSRLTLLSSVGLRWAS